MLQQAFLLASATPNRHAPWASEQCNHDDARVPGAQAGAGNTLRGMATRFPLIKSTQPQHGTRYALQPAHTATQARYQRPICHPRNSYLQWQLSN